MIRSEELRFPAHHPAFAGHFPGEPVMPAVVLLDAALHAAAAANASEASRWQVSAAKFHLVVRPGQPLTLEHERMPNGAVRFAIRREGQIVASGTFRSFHESGGAGG